MHSEGRGYKSHLTGFQPRSGIKDNEIYVCTVDNLPPTNVGIGIKNYREGNFLERDPIDRESVVRCGRRRSTRRATPLTQHTVLSLRVVPLSCT